MDIIIISALTLNNAIGKKGGLIFHIPSDLKRFKEETMGHTVVMGRKTMETLPNGKLSGRRNIVLSRSENTYDGVEVFQSVESVLEAVKMDRKVFVIGGEEVYKAFLPYASELHLTFINELVSDADTFFPQIDENVFFPKEVTKVKDVGYPSYSYVRFVRTENEK